MQKHLNFFALENFAKLWITPNWKKDHVYGECFLAGQIFALSKYSNVVQNFFGHKFSIFVFFSSNAWENFFCYNYILDLVFSLGEIFHHLSNVWTFFWKHSPIGVKDFLRCLLLMLHQKFEEKNICPWILSPHNINHTCF